MKRFFYNISPIIGSSNHKGIVFLFFVSLDENQSSQYSFSRKEEVCFHFFFAVWNFFRENFFTFRGISSMYVCIFVESIFLMSRLQSLRPILFFLSTTKSTWKRMLEISGLFSNFCLLVKHKQRLELFWPFTVWINCSSDLKKNYNSRPSASNFKSFSRSLERFFLTVGQNNFGNKIPK